MRARWILPFVAAAFLAGTASAGDVIYFDNGTTMSVLSHRVENGMVHVELEDDAVMAFPEYMVEKIDGTAKAQPRVQRRKSAGNGRMVTAPGREEERATDSRASLSKPDPNNDPGVGRVAVDDKGVAVHRPFANSKNPGKRLLGAAGRRQARRHNVAGVGAVQNDGGYRGTTRNGTRQTLGPSNPRGRSDTKPEIIGLQRAPGRKGSND